MTPKLRAAAALTLAALVLGACRVTVSTDVAVDRNAAGLLTLAITGDTELREALARGGLAETGEALFGASAQRDLRAGPDGTDPFADLRAQGWEVTPVAGGVEIRHRWSDPAELGSIVAGLGGGDPTLSPIQELSVAPDRGFPKDAVELHATMGLAPATLLRLATSGAPNAPTEAEIEGVVGAPLQNLVTMRVHVEMPGSVVELHADPEPVSRDDLTWNLEPGGELRLAVRSDYWSGLVAWTGIALGSLVVLFAAFVVWRRMVVVRRRRARIRPTPQRNRLPSSPARRL